MPGPVVRRPGGGKLDGAFDEIFAVNVKSQLTCVRAALPELRAAGSRLRSFKGSGHLVDDE